MRQIFRLAPSPKGGLEERAPPQERWGAPASGLPNTTGSPGMPPERTVC